MTFLSYFVDLVSCYVTSDFMRYWWYPLIAVAFLATVPRLLVSLVAWR